MTRGRLLDRIIGDVMASTVPAAKSVMRVAFQVRAALECRGMAIDLVSAIIAHVPGADRMFRHEMVTAFGEAFNNIVAHGYRDQADGMVEIEADIRHGELVLHLKDKGASVDYAAVIPPDLATLPESGMGVYIMHAMVDEVAYSGGPLNVLSLTKRTGSDTSEHASHVGTDQ